jgi:inositol phosphorylceramide mannosyltransferase catalytic subunit
MNIFLLVCIFIIIIIIINIIKPKKIPKIIHQTYKDHNLPENYKLCQDEIKKLHPDFEYRFYTDKDMDNYIKKNFPSYYKKFNELPRKIMKIDMFRYFLMYKEGGLYADMDYLMFKPFNLLNYDVVIPTNRDRDEKGNITNLGNCFFASKPNNMFWKTLIDTLFLIDRKNEPTSDDDVINSTGPMFVFKMYSKYKYKDKIHVPERMLFHPPTKNNKEYIDNLKKTDCYGIHLCEGLWIKNKF